MIATHIGSEVGACCVAPLHGPSHSQLCRLQLKHNSCCHFKDEEEIIRKENVRPFCLYLPTTSTMYCADAHPKRSRNIVMLCWLVIDSAKPYNQSINEVGYGTENKWMQVYMKARR